jgi:hypothetical protein
VKKGEFTKSILSRFNAISVESLLAQYEFLEFGFWRAKAADFISKGRYCEAACECGFQKNIDKYDLFNGKSKSCGCKMVHLIQKNCMEKHGVLNYCETDDFKAKSEKTHMHKYGVANISLLPEYRRKAEKTCIERYNIHNPGGTQESFEKARMKIESNDRSSKGEIEIRGFIKSLGFEAPKTFCGGAKSQRCEIDMIIKDKNIAIEYNGDFFHSEYRLGSEYYHLNKTNETRKQKNCQLIHIFESEWHNRKQQVKYLLFGLLLRGETISARKCEIKHIEIDISYDFCDQYYIKGRPDSSILSIGLYHGNELLSVMILDKQQDELELVRFVTKPNYRIHGGLSKMSQYLYDRIGDFITYIDRRLNASDSFIKSGYTEIETYPPDYRYWDSKKHLYITKDKYTEISQIAGLYKVWDSGKIKLKFSLDKSLI